MLNLIKWLIFSILLILLGRLLALGLSYFALAPAYWMNGIYWAAFTGILLGFLFWALRISSPDFSLISALALYVIIIVFSQIDFYDYCVDNYVAEVAEVEGKERLSLKETRLRFADYVQKEVGASTILWFDNLRVFANRGISHYESQGSSKYGGRKNVYVKRQGFWIWWGWFLVYIFLAIGCFCGLYGAALVEDKENKGITFFNKHIYKRLEKSLLANGLSKKMVKTILRKPKEETLNSIAVQNFLPLDDLSLAYDILNDFKRIQVLEKESIFLSFIDDEEIKIIKENARSFYNPVLDENQKLNSYDFFLLSSTRLKKRLHDKSFYECMNFIRDIAYYFSISLNIPPFKSLNIEGIIFEECDIDELWSPLLKQEQKFYDDGKVWNSLKKMAVDEIPENVYMAIIHQTFEYPDRSESEWWRGYFPLDYMEKLAPKMRNAILTYFTNYRSFCKENKLSGLQEIASYAAYWSQEEAEEFFIRCIEAGWSSALEKIPQSAAWEEFLDKYKETPFGPLSVKWFKRD